MTKMRHCIRERYFQKVPRRGNTFFKTEILIADLKEEKSEEDTGRKTGDSQRTGSAGSGKENPGNRRKRNDTG